MNLAPEIIKMRDALLERIGDKPLNEVGQIVNEILLNETNNVNRLAALAARVKILKDKINKPEINYTEINVNRYVDWSITTPIMLLVLILAVAAVLFNIFDTI